MHIRVNNLKTNKRTQLNSVNYFSIGNNKHSDITIDSRINFILHIIIYDKFIFAFNNNEKNDYNHFPIKSDFLTKKKLITKTSYFFKNFLHILNNFNIKEKEKIFLNLIEYFWNFYACFRPLKQTGRPSDCCAEGETPPR